MPESQKQFDFSRGAQLSALRRLRLPDGISKDGSNVRSATLLAVLRAIDDRCGKNGQQWWDQATLAAQAGLGVRQTARAIQVLESMHLIQKIDTRRGGARRLVISIEWQTVFSDSGLYQDPTILAEWGLLTKQLDSDSNSALEGFNSALSAEFNSAPSAQLIRHLVPNSLLSKTPIHPPTLDEGEGVGGIESDFETTETVKHEQEAMRQKSSNTTETPQDAQYVLFGHVRAMENAYDEGKAYRQAVSKGVEKITRKVASVDAMEGIGVREDHPTWKKSAHDDGDTESASTILRTPSPMTTRTIDPRERQLIRRLVDLGVGSAVATLREALRIGYSCEAVAAILDFYQRETLTDPQTGENVPPYYTGQLVKRLRDEHATDARPDCGHWGGRTAEWSALKLRLTGPKPEPGRVPDLSRARRSALVESFDRSQVIFCLEVLASGDGPDVPRAVKCLAWVEQNWSADLNPQPLIPPPAVFKFLMEFDVERILNH